MNRDDDFITRLEDYLETIEGVTTLPARTRDAVRADVPRTRQLGPVRAAWPARPRLAIAAAAVAIIAIVGVSTLNVVTRDRGHGVGGVLVATPGLSPKPSPSRSPTASPALPPIDTSTWVPYVSDRYGFSIAHPEDWEVNRAERNWTFPSDAVAPVPGDATELFESTLNPDGLGIWVSAWSVPVAPGTSTAEWIADYCLYGAKSCTGIPDRAEPATMDGHAGLLVPFGDTTGAFFLLDDRMYILAIWRAEDDLSVRPYGGARRILEAFLSTVRLLPDGPPVAPSSSPTG